jgi:hypothetical protein
MEECGCVQVCGSLLSFRSAIRQQVLSLGLLPLYHHSPHFTYLVRMLCAMAFLPPDRLAELYDEGVLVHLAEQPTPADEDSVVQAEAVDSLLAYFEATWLGTLSSSTSSSVSPHNRKRRRWRPLHPPELWNQFDAALAGRADLALLNCANSWARTVGDDRWMSRSLDHCHSHRPAVLTLVEKFFQADADYLGAAAGEPIENSLSPDRRGQVTDEPSPVGFSNGGDETSGQGPAGVGSVNRPTGKSRELLQLDALQLNLQTVCKYLHTMEPSEAFRRLVDILTDSLIE